MTKRLIVPFLIILFASFAFADLEQEINVATKTGIGVPGDIDATEASRPIQPEDRGFGREDRKPIGLASEESMNFSDQDDEVTGLEYQILNPQEEANAAQELEQTEGISVLETSRSGGEKPLRSMTTGRDLESLRNSFIHHIENNNCESLYVSSKWIADSLQSLGAQEVLEFVNELRALGIESTCDVESETMRILAWLSGQIGSRLAVSKPVLNFNGQVFFNSQTSEAQLHVGDEIQVLFLHNSIKHLSFSYNFITNLNLEIDYQLQQLFHGNASHLIIAHITITQEIIDTGYLEIILNVSDASDESKILDMQVAHIRL